MGGCGMVERTTFVRTSDRTPDRTTERGSETAMSRKRPDALQRNGMRREQARSPRLTDDRGRQPTTPHSNAADNRTQSMKTLKTIGQLALAIALIAPSAEKAAAQEKVTLLNVSYDP